MRICSAIVCAVVVASGAAHGQDLVWNGRLRCEAAPSVNLPESSLPMTLRREGNIVVFARPVIDRETRREIGQEAGTATVRDNRFTIDTQLQSGRSLVNGRYDGTILGETVTLSGKQTMMFNQRGAGERACQARHSSRPG